VLPTEFLKKIQEIEIRTKNLVNTLFAGDYKSSFKGRGIEFLDVREYLPGDDVRTIDWKVTARFGKPYVKKYAEEKGVKENKAIEYGLEERVREFKRTGSELYTTGSNT